MIVPMKKIAVIVQSEESEQVLHSLRSLGVLHVEHQNPPSGKSINSLKDEIAVLDRAVNILSSPGLTGKSGIRSVRLMKDWQFTTHHILDTVARIDHLAEYSRSLAAQIAAWEAWGDFDPGTLTSLRDKGINIKLCQIPVKELSVVPEEVILKKIFVSKTMAYCALISREKIELPYKDEGLPKMSLAEMKARLTENDDITRILKETLRKYTCYLDKYLEIRRAFGKELELQEALRGMGDAGQIAYVVGYAPSDKVANLEEMAKIEKWGISIKEPSAEDNVPTLVRNPRWVSTIAPVFKLIEIVAGYREMDISPVFLLFLSLFFGMIVGDAGYGALYIIATFFAQRKIGRTMKDHSIFHLFYLFSAFAVLWGILTGTVFGQEWYLKAGFRAVLPVLNNTKELQAFCFFLGALHLTIAQSWQAVRKLPSIIALADVGWICVLWAGFFAARMLILSDPMPAFTKWIIITGVSLVILFTSPQKNIVKMLGQGLGTLALNIMNNFTDVVSYIRLFAVGLAGVAISDTVNTLAAEVGPANLIVYLLILLAGHTINILLGPMSVMVHGLRLNVLEFSSHAGLTWSGTAYKPLKQ